MDYNLYYINNNIINDLNSIFTTIFIDFCKQGKHDEAFSFIGK